MSNRTISFESEHRAFAYIFAGAITLATFPIVGWHYASTLTGLALAAIAGLLLTDIILWFSSHWSVKVQSGALRAVALTVKFALSLVMVINAGIVIFLMRGDHQTEAIIHQQTEARKAEIAARADAAAKLAQVQGGRSAAREAMRMEAAPDAQAVASNTRAQLEEYVPAWYLSIGIYIAPPFVAIIGFMALTVCASIIKRREREAEAEAETERPQARPQAKQDIAPSLPAQAPAYGAGKPTVKWIGHTRIDPGQNIRPS